MKTYDAIVIQSQGRDICSLTLPLLTSVAVPTIPNNVHQELAKPWASALQASPSLFTRHDLSVHPYRSLSSFVTISIHACLHHTSNPDNKLFYCVFASTFSMKDYEKRQIVSNCSIFFYSFYFNGLCVISTIVQHVSHVALACSS